MSQRLRFRDAVPTRRNLHENKEAVAGLRTSATAFYLGMIRNPRSMWPLRLNKGLAEMARRALGGAIPKSHKRLPTRYRYSIRPMRERPNHSRLGSAFHLWNALPPETSPARSAGSLFDSDKGWTRSALERTCRSAAHGARGQRTARFVVASAQLISCSCCGTAHFNLRAAGTAVRFSHRVADCILQALTFLNSVSRRRIGLADHFRELLPCSSMWS